MHSSGLTDFLTKPQSQDIQININLSEKWIIVLPLLFSQYDKIAHQPLQQGVLSIQLKYVKQLMSTTLAGMIRQEWVLE